MRIQEETKFKEKQNKSQDCIEEDENKTWENTDNKLRSFLYDELDVTDELYIDSAHRVRRSEACQC